MKAIIPGVKMGAKALALVLAVQLLSACTRLEMMLADSEGERLWIQHCANCHGLDGAGNTPRSMGNQYADLIDDNWSRGGDQVALEESIREGVVGQMPEFEDLSRDEVKELVHYIRELRGERKPR